jgi:hypothetical protein
MLLFTWRDRRFQLSFEFGWFPSLAQTNLCHEGSKEAIFTDRTEGELLFFVE